jgi:hypothetical protein
MIVNRRVFVAGVALAAVAPALRVLPAGAAVPTLNDVVQPTFMISGWSRQDGPNPDDQLWLRIDDGWRIGWR